MPPGFVVLLKEKRRLVSVIVLENGLMCLSLQSFTDVMSLVGGFPHIVGMFQMLYR